MFREVGLDPGERNFYRFLMRNESEDLADYRMKRLTFGVKSSPFLATMVLLHHADCHNDSHPITAHLVQTAFYVDDCLTGAPTIEEAALIREQLCDLLSKCKMTLRNGAATRLSCCPQSLSPFANRPTYRSQIPYPRLRLWGYIGTSPWTIFM